MTLFPQTVSINKHDCFHLSQLIDLLLNVAAVLNNLTRKQDVIITSAISADWLTPLWPVKSVIL